ncbi:hypothetical protein [Nocardia terpenica]|uniref:Uncharacterized protein n=1 Tax=Nocardia terpenica TaxID=455432 RepID=A0A291RDF1_9NOCA|nr:hypothetical protein [Nocardia terpenica]ATL65144.1 hypothetical protein CRH09_01760 [Nocardia terpenica]
MITHLLGYLAMLIFATTCIAVMLVGYATYTATGLPSFRGAALREMKQHILNIRGGQPITRRQRLRGELRQWLVDGWKPSAAIASREPAVSWAYGICEQAAKWDTDAHREERTMMFHVLSHPHGAASSEVFATLETRADSAADWMLIKFTESFSADDILSDAQRQWGELSQIRRTALLQSTFRDPEWRRLCAPLVTKFLDYSGRGAAAGLITGVAYAGTKQVTSMVEVVSLTSLLGASVAHFTFLGVVAAVLGRQDPHPMRGWRWVFAHPIAAPLLLSLAVAAYVYGGMFLFRWIPTMIT